VLASRFLIVVATIELAVQFDVAEYPQIAFWPELRGLRNRSYDEACCRSFLPATWSIFPTARRRASHPDLWLRYVKKSHAM